jgi:hypothetical protein
MQMSKLDEDLTPGDSTMNALIIYQDFASAAEANTVLQHTTQHSDVRVQWNIRPWRVDMLKFPPTAEEALGDAADAHLIVFVGSCVESLPFWLRHWLEHWAKCRQIQNAALAVLRGENGAALSALATHHLSLFAEQHGLSFIVDGSFTAEAAEKFSASNAHKDKPQPISTRPPLYDATIHDRYRHWGINE